MELFYFKYSLNPELTKTARRLSIPDRQPFLIDEEGTPLDHFCKEIGLNSNDCLDLSQTAQHIAALSDVLDANDYLLVRAATSKSPNTWKAEAEQLCIFLRWVKAQGKTWRDITLEDLQSFYRTRRLQPSAHTKRPISRKTWNSCVGAVSRFYKWAVDVGRIKQTPFTFRQVTISPTEVVDKNTLTEPMPEEPIRYLTLEEYKIFKHALRQSRNGGRDIAFSDLLVSTGVRLSEGNGLTVGQIPDPEAPRYKGILSIPFIVKGKGGKTRRIRFPKSTLREIEIYKSEDRANALARWRSRTSKISDQARIEPVALWLSERGTPMSNARWEEIFAEASKRCGIHCTPHMLRHTYAIFTLSALIEKTICSINELQVNGSEQYGKLIHNPLRKLADLLGHSRIETTFLYLDFVEQCEAVVDDAIAEWDRNIL